MTISSLSKMVLGVKNIVVEKVEAELESAGRNRPDMTAETVFADGVPPISAVESRCMSKPKRQEYATRNMV